MARSSKGLGSENCSEKNKILIFNNHRSHRFHLLWIVLHLEKKLLYFSKQSGTWRSSRGTNKKHTCVVGFQFFFILDFILGGLILVLLLFTVIDFGPLLSDFFGNVSNCASLTEFFTNLCTVICSVKEECGQWSFWSIWVLKKVLV